MAESSLGWLAAAFLIPLCCGGASLPAAGGFGILAAGLASKGLLILASAAVLAAMLAFAVFLKRRRGKTQEGQDCCE